VKRGGRAWVKQTISERNEEKVSPRVKGYLAGGGKNEDRKRKFAGEGSPSKGKMRKKQQVVGG